MNGSGTNILSLNSYCLYNIFRQIQINGENAHNTKDALGKYLDLINFAISCNVFTKAFKEWNPELYEELRLTLDFSDRTQFLKVNLSNLYNLMHNQSKNEQKLFWSAYLNAIEENDELESVKVIYKPAQYYPQHMDRFEALLNVLKEKKKLRVLDIKLKGYSFESVDIKGLETLHVNARMDVDDLILLCQINPNLRRLKLSSAELSGRLCDIVPYCNHLEYLTISMKTGLDAAQYAPLAQLPQLRDLTLLGEHKEGSLLKLFQGLEGTLIEQISIPNVYLTIEEQNALLKISSLTSLKCCPKDPEINNVPANLKKTYSRFPQNKNNQMDLETGKYRMRFLISGKRINSPEIAREYAKLCPGYKILHWQCIFHSMQFHTDGWITTDELGLFLTNYSKHCLYEVSKIELFKDMPITQKQIDTLGAYPSITYIKCYLHQLRQMIAVKVQHLNGIDGFSRLVHCIRTVHCDVRVLKVGVPDLWTVVLDFFEKDVSINASIFTPLINLRNLTSLKIVKNLRNGSLKALFKSFASMEIHILEELRVTFLGPEEIVEVAKIRSLKNLECGFFCSRFIDHLATMNQLETLTITVHPLGRLKTLFKALASRQNPTLEYLTIQRVRLTSEEVIELSRIESLLGVELGIPRTHYWLHSLSNKIGSLYVHYCQKCRLPQRDSDDVQHSIYIKALPSNHEPRFDTQVNFLTELYETLTPSNLHLLTMLPRLKSLSIDFEHQLTDVENLYRTLALEAPKRLQKITFGSQDFKLMSRFEELQHLDCFFYHIQDIDSVCLLRNLRWLTLHNPDGIDMLPILRELREFPHFHTLIVNGKDLDKNEIREVVQIKTLRQLMVGLASNDLFKYLILATSLEILEVTSTHYANENDVDYISLICMKCTKLLAFSLFRYYGYITKQKAEDLLAALICFRKPSEYPYLLLQGTWVDFKRLNQVNLYNDLYLQLMPITEYGYPNSDESEESDSDVDT